MTCRMCQAEFCYYCRSIWNSSHNTQTCAETAEAAEQETEAVEQVEPASLRRQSQRFTAAEIGNCQRLFHKVGQ